MEEAPTNGEPKKASRSEAKDAAVRAKLVPLAEGERPRAVTVAAIVALLLGLSTVVLYLAGQEVQGERPHLLAAAQSALMFTAAWGMWKAKYWAVLGMQTILGLLLVICALSLVTARNAVGVVILLTVIAASGSLFWFLVKAMARIQMPERR